MAPQNHNRRAAVDHTNVGSCPAMLWLNLGQGDSSGKMLVIPRGERSRLCFPRTSLGSNYGRRLSLISVLTCGCHPNHRTTTPMRFYEPAPKIGIMGMDCKCVGMMDVGVYSRLLRLWLIWMFGKYCQMLQFVVLIV